MDKRHSHALYSYSDIDKLSPLDVDMTVINNPDSDKSGDLLDTWSVNYSSDLVSTPNDLVSLAWLQKRDILQIAPLDGEEDGSDSVSSAIAGQTEDDDNFESNPIVHMDSLEPVVNRSPSLMPVSQFSILDRCVRRPASVSGDQLSHNEQSRFSTNPTVPLGTHGLTKPNYSYTHLIFMAIESTPQKCMTVNQIYNWCESNFPFYKHAGVGWKNSLRHNLSINKSFKRLPRDSRVSLSPVIVFSFGTVRDLPISLFSSLTQNEPNILNCRSLDMLCSQKQEHEDFDDDDEVIEIVIRTTNAPFISLIFPDAPVLLVLYRINCQNLCKCLLCRQLTTSVAYFSSLLPSLSIFK